MALVTVIVLVLAGALGACSGGAALSKDLHGAASSSTSQASTSASTDILKQKTTVLEYSSKDVDPLTLVEITEPDAEVSAEGAIDLGKVGIQNVRYTVSLNGDKAEEAFDFTVRDTKPPEIKLAEQPIEVTQNTEFDAASVIVSVADPVDGALPQVNQEPEVEPESGSASSSAGDAGESSSGSNTTKNSPPSSSREKGIVKLYESGWYLIDGSADTSAPGTYTLTVLACDKHGNRVSKEFPVTVVAAEAAPAAEEAAESPAAEVSAYVLNTNTHKFHRPDCASVKKMKDKNRQDVEMTREEVVSAGYEPCQNCNP